MSKFVEKDKKTEKQNNQTEKVNESGADVVVHEDGLSDDREESHCEETSEDSSSDDSDTSLNCNDAISNEAIHSTLRRKLPDFD